jgi:hypothetical protein
MDRSMTDAASGHTVGPSSRWVSIGWLALGIVWALTLAAGFTELWKYKLRPGQADGAPAAWPAESRILRGQERATLVLFAHPQCPCTRASVAELARLMSRFDGRLSAAVVFIHPTNVGDDWDHTDLWQRASEIPGVTSVRDDDGREAARFRASTSGMAFLYDPQGRLLFSGGLTSARGHEGDSLGLQRISSLLRTGTADRADAPVFGCSLRHD